MINYLLSIMLGFLSKTVDLADEHGLRMKTWLKYLLSIIYGVIMAYLISVIYLPEFFFGILIGIILSNKIDSKPHILAVVCYLVASFIFGFSITNWTVVIITAFLCIIEEWINDNIVDKKKVKGLLLKVLNLRPVLEITAIVLSVIYSNISIFLMLLFFDIGYGFSRFILKGKLQPQKAKSAKEKPRK